MSTVSLFYANDNETIHAEYPPEFPGQIRLVRRTFTGRTTHRVDTVMQAVEVYLRWVKEAEEANHE